MLLWLLSLFVNMDHTSWDESVVDGLHFIEHSVLQIPFFLMTMMRYINPTLDHMYASLPLRHRTVFTFLAGSWTPSSG